MPEFIDQYMPSAVPGYPCVAIPRTNTLIAINAGGKEKRTKLWDDPKYHFTLPDAPGRDWAVVTGLKNHWLITAGPHKSFPFRDPTDFASVDLNVPNVVPTITMLDQEVGTGDGITEIFQLYKTYTVGGETYTRTIYCPIRSTVLVAINGVLVDSADYTVTREGGTLTFDVPPPNGQLITAGFLFDVIVRFEDDDMLEAVVRSYQVGGFADIGLVEVGVC